MSSARSVTRQGALFIPALPPPSAREQSPISTLPVELLGKILHWTYDKPGGYFCRQDMSKAALVSTAWRDPALERLWRTVEVDLPGEVERIARTSRGTTYRTKTVRFLAEESAGWIERFLGRLVGVEALEVGACVGLAPFFLGLPSLSGLTQLHLDLLLGPEMVDDLILPTRLTYLSLGPDVTSTKLLLALLFSSSDTLETLALEDCSELDIAVDADGEPDIPLPPAHAPILPSLNLLRFNYTSSDVANALMSRSPNLRRVECRADSGYKNLDWLKAILESVPSHLETLVFTDLRDKDSYRRSIIALTNRLEAGPWEGLRDIIFSAPEARVRGIEGGDALLNRLARRTPPVTITFKYRPFYGHLNTSNDGSADGDVSSESEESDSDNSAWETHSDESDGSEEDDSEESDSD
ncbi:hypothetical protein RQP46_011229 [Phenoliferia psychrophenolica]